MSDFVRTCGVGQPGHVCGQRAIGMVAVQSFRDVHIEVPLTPGIVYLCKRHYYNPILEPSAAEMAQDERAGVASDTEAEKGTELRPCDSVALTALRVERDDLRVRLAERDAQVTALTRRLSEGLG